MKIEYKKTSEIRPYQYNPRKNEKAVEVVANSIKEFGFLVPVIIDQNNTLIAGHTRYEAAKLLGIEEIPSIKAENLNEEQIKAFRIMDNKSQEYAKWDRDLLKTEFENLLGKIDLKKTGFREAEIEKIMNPKTPDSKGNIPGKYQIKKGQVYTLGQHRLICGDSKEEMTFNKLIPPKEEIQMVYTDPPYGVSYSGTNNPNGRQWNVIEGDALRGNELYELLSSCFKNMEQYMSKNSALYVFHASANQILFEKAINEAGFEVRQQLIWHKHHILGHSHYHWTHEPIFYAGKKGQNPKFYGTRDNKTFLNKLDPDNMTEQEMRDYLKQIKKESTVKEYKRGDPKKYIHPTQKPVKLAEHFLINSSRIGENVLDPFAGSGSTLIACENKNRRCMAIEYDEDFTSHIIERWENMTGRKAKTEQGNDLKIKQTKEEK